MNRFTAAGIHLGISFLIFLVLAYFVLYQWYPGIFFETDGGWRGMQILVFVDLVLGPLLTLVVFNINKPELKRDLAIIGLIQFSCLFAGTWVVYSERPLAVVFDHGRFYAMNSDSYLSGRPNLEHLPGKFPKWAILTLPEDPSVQSEIRKEFSASGGLVLEASEYYEPFTSNHPKFQKYETVLPLILSKGKSKEALQAWMKQVGGKPDDYVFYPFSSRYVYTYIAFAKGSDRPAGILNMSIFEVANESEN